MIYFVITLAFSDFQPLYPLSVEYDLFKYGQTNELDVAVMQEHQMLLSAVHVLRVPTRMKQVLCCTQKCASFQIAVHALNVGEKVRVRVVDLGIPRDLRFGRLCEVLGALILNKKTSKKNI